MGLGSIVKAPSPPFVTPYSSVLDTDWEVMYYQRGIYNVEIIEGAHATPISTPAIEGFWNSSEPFLCFINPAIIYTHSLLLYNCGEFLGCL